MPRDALEERRVIDQRARGRSANSDPASHDAAPMTGALLNRLLVRRSAEGEKCGFVRSPELGKTRALIVGRFLGS